MLYGMIFVHSFLAAARIKWARYNIRLWRYYTIKTDIYHMKLGVGCSGKGYEK